MHVIGKHLLRAFYKLFSLRFCVSSDQRKNTVQQRFYKDFDFTRTSRNKDFTRTSREILYENNCNHNSYKFSYKLLAFIPFCSLIEVKNKLEAKLETSQVRSSSTNVHVIGKHLLRAFYKLFSLRFCVSSDQRKNTVQQRFYKDFDFTRTSRNKDFTRTSREILYENNCNHNSYKFSYKLLAFIPFCSLIEIKNKNQIFSKLVVW